MKKDLYENLTEEQIAKVKACKNGDEILALAKKEGIELTDEQLAAVGGGICTPSSYHVKCSKCESRDNKKWKISYEMMGAKCNKCGCEFEYVIV